MIVHQVLPEGTIPNKVAIAILGVMATLGILSPGASNRNGRGK